MNTDDFVFLAVRGFGLGFGLGFIIWGFSYSIRVLRTSFIRGMRIVE